MIRDDLVSLRDFFKQGMQFSVVEEMVNIEIRLLKMGILGKREGSLEPKHREIDKFAFVTAKCPNRLISILIYPFFVGLFPCSIVVVPLKFDQQL